MLCALSFPSAPAEHRHQDRIAWVSLGSHSERRLSLLCPLLPWAPTLSRHLSSCGFSSSAPVTPDKPPPRQQGLPCEFRGAQRHPGLHPLGARSSPPPPTSSALVMTPETTPDSTTGPLGTKLPGPTLAGNPQPPSPLCLLPRVIFTLPRTRRTRS